MKQGNARSLCLAAAVAALYAGLTFLSSALGLAYGPVQFRLGEALCLLPFLYPWAGWGLVGGCLLSNLLSPYGLLDLIFGTLSTALATWLSRHARNKWLAALPPVLCNMLIVSAVIAYEQTGFAAAFTGLFFYNAATIGLGEAAVCFLLGVPLLTWLEKQEKK